ncbi:hypothetical protein SSPS47_27385 [Streptomyces sp. S4.7]|uniref:hypothetical protein n=1 Tax=Streptomyces sp. S4.7 TaxID=2705439 RepID=UPI0013980317|nr:hypothetical protein [Streptomyces sp. S4.7]QHY98833.1 hypothetical protein SSPS47_27385 [Streptomyces sp. S4.7]
MIEQASVQTADLTAPTIQDIRTRISQAVDATAGPVLDRLKFWLQMPTDSMFLGMMDNDCQVRAQRVGAQLSPGAGGPYGSSDLSVPLEIEGRWAAVDEAVKGDRAVIIKGSTGHVGGGESKFNNQLNTGFHVIVFLAVGQEPAGRRYYLGFDPDVSATAESRAKWKPLVLGGTEARAQRFDDAKSVQVVKAMILGDAQDAFGPLVRKYYVETDKAFPKIVHA